MTAQLGVTAVLRLNRVQCSVEVEQGVQSVRTTTKHIVAPDLCDELIASAALRLFGDLSGELNLGSSCIECLNQYYKGFPTFASNTSPWMDRCTISPGTGLLIGQQSAPNLVLAARRCLLANGADGVTTNGH